MRVFGSVVDADEASPLCSGGMSHWITSDSPVFSASCAASAVWEHASALPNARISSESSTSSPSLSLQIVTSSATSAKGGDATEASFSCCFEATATSQVTRAMERKYASTRRISGSTRRSKSAIELLSAASARASSFSDIWAYIRAKQYISNNTGRHTLCPEKELPQRWHARSFSEVASDHRPMVCLAAPTSECISMNGQCTRACGKAATDYQKVSLQRHSSTNGMRCLGNTYSIGVFKHTV